jgi:hypothetical protein
MKRKSVLKLTGVVLAFISVLLASSLALAQATGALRGRVADPSDAVIPQATVTLTGAAGQRLTATTKADGSYEFKDLPPGKYNLRVVAKGFAPFELAEVVIEAGPAQRLDAALAIEVEKQVVNVEEQATNVNVDASSNASAIVLKGKDLDALSDDPDQLQADLQALAGPSAGPNGGQIYIDGFSGGQLPPKSAIREVRINQNPFSAEFDHIGFGRIEVFTKPGQDKFRGSFMTNLNNSVFNSRNPFVTGAFPGYHSEQFSGNFSGPINKKSSFFFNLERRNVNDSSIINAVVLDSNFAPVPFSQAVLHPQVRMSVGPRIDYQLTKNNTLTARYHYNKSTSSNNGIGDFSLPTQANSRSSNNQELQLSDTQIISNFTVNETRFEYSRDRSQTSPVSVGTSIGVSQAFTGGGSNGGSSISHGDNIELQNLTMQSRGTHMMKWGGRLRYDRSAAYSNSGFYGSFSFANINAYQWVQQGLANGQTMAQLRTACLSVVDSTGNPVNTLLDCSPRQFSITYGLQNTLISQADLGVYFADDWRVRRNLTFSYGVRYETQGNISDHADLAPRLALAWGIGKGKGTPKTVLRAGFGIFYDRFAMGNVLRTQTLNGVFQQQYTIQPTDTNPAALDFYANLPALPSLADLQAGLLPQSIYKINPNLRTPYMMQAAVSLERQITKTTTVAVNYVASRGLHQLTTYNLNATTGLPQDASHNRVFQFSDTGFFKQQQLMIIPSIRISSTISLNSFYTLSWAKSTPGTPSNPLNLMADFGRSGFDVRQRFMIMGSVSLPYGFRINPNVNISSGRPFDITTGFDANGDTFFNERPSFANPTNVDPAYTKYVVQTPWGLFNRKPLAGEKIIPINYGTGPGMVTVGMRISKTFAIGKRKMIADAGQGGPGDRGFGGPGGGPGGPGGGGDHGPGPGGAAGGGGGGPRGGGGFGGGRMMMGGGGGRGGANTGRYSLTISADARNLLNHVNYGNPISDLGQPLSRIGSYTNIAGGGGPGGAFGGTSANRRISLQAMFSF